MRDKINNLALQMGIDSYVDKLYQIGIKKPYWYVSGNIFNSPLKKEIAGVEAKFIIEAGSEIDYHEFGTESNIISNLLLELKTDDVFYDIGANIGIYSCFSGNVLDDGQVVSFEPSPFPYRRLVNNLALNDIAGEPYQIAISDSDGKVEFGIDTTDQFSRTSSLSISKADSSHKVKEIPVRKLDTVIDEEGLKSPTVVKIDVEGAESRVLRGMKSIIGEVRVIYCEVHEDLLRDFGSNPHDLFKELEDSGYSIKTLENRNHSKFIKASI